MARPRRSDETRLRLLDEGVAAFLEHGYHGAGLADVLARADVPKGSFYNYFRSKEEFGAEAIRHYATSFGEKLRDTLRAAPDPRSGLQRFFRGLMREFADAGFAGGCLVANLAGELEGTGICRDALKGGFDGWRDAVADALREGQELGQFRRDLGARELADLFAEAWEGAVLRMKIERSLEPLERCLTRFLGDFLAPGR